MEHRGSSDEASIRRIVRRINELWLSQRYAEIGELLSESAVVVLPGFTGRIRGREAYVQSYREYDQSARTLEFSPDDPEIDIVGEVAVSVCPFSIVYEVEGKTYREKGRDVLVLSRSGSEWKVAWRTMQIEQAEKSAG